MESRLKKNGTRAFVAVVAVCAALSPAALAAVGGVAAREHTTGGVHAARLTPVHTVWVARSWPGSTTAR